MPYILILLGTMLFVSGIRGTQKDLWNLVSGDVTGQDSFLVWIAAIAVVGALGYIPKLRPFSIGFMSLLLLVLIIRKDSGAFAQLASFVQNPGPQTPASGPKVAGLQPLTPLAPLQGAA